MWLCELTHFSTLITYAKHLATELNLEYVGEILRPAAGMLLMDELQVKFTPYFDNLKTAGTQLISNEAIDADLHKKLHVAFISSEEFRIKANEYFKKI